MGPIETRLSAFGRVRGLVIGPRAECSPDLHRLVGVMADVGAVRSWRQMGARSVGEAQRVIKTRVRRMIGINAARAGAVLKRERLGISLGGGKAAAKRRKSALFKARTMREERYDQQFGGGPCR